MDSPIDDADRQAALKELRAVLERSRGVMILRHPSGAQAQARQLAEALEKCPNGAVMVLPNTLDDLGNPEWSYEPADPLLGALTRLCWLLGLSSQERAFVQAGLEKPEDASSLMAYADWFLEQGRITEARALQERIAR